MYIPGKDPAMVFLDADNKVVLEKDVSEKSLEEIGRLLEKHGMVKSKEARSEVPEDPWEDFTRFVKKKDLRKEF
ncbi:hypothetical protein P5673_000285 [Acropora cervicornis]|uniref:Selenoprotein F/M domain-containing protein n=1 Tax=Acropora cervicornis TaxID=6130 RepID=A0AAD9R6V2_ACRCE|nr:hypothetical protein P5673_000285 [Acropora cervicornis]